MSRSDDVKLDKKRLGYAAVAVILIVIASFAFRGGGSVQYVTAKVQRGEIHDVVEATGTLNAVRTVQVGSQVSGTIAKLNADFNSRVHVGDIVALIEPSLFEGAMQQATANLESAKANVVAAQAALDKSKASLVQTKADFARIGVLAKDRVETQQSLDLAKSNYDIAAASVAGAEAGVVQARAQVTQAEAAVTIARANLAYTVIRSPVDGIVVARNVDVGQTVAASLQAPTIFTIAKDLTHMQLYAKTDESDVGRIKTAQPVTFKVDAFPKETFHGTVSQMRMNATTVQNVVTYDCIIDFDNPELKLFPGMTAYVTIPVATVQNVVKLPNTALRYKPALSPEELRAIYAKYGIEESSSVEAGAPESPGAAAPSRGPRRETAVVWKLRSDNSIEPVKVALGITDHAYTEVSGPIKGELKADDDVVTASIASKSAAPAGPGVRR
jgi:HlyD family secretion protein